MTAAADQAETEDVRDHRHGDHHGDHKDRPAAAAETQRNPGGIKYAKIRSSPFWSFCFVHIRKPKRDGPLC